MSEIVLRRSYPAVGKAIAQTRRDVVDAADVLGADADAIENMRLAVSEAATHVVGRSATDGSGHVHVLVTRPDGESLALTVTGDGEASPVFRPEAGLSVAFIVMRDCADSLKIRRTYLGETEISMTFAVSLPPRPRGGEDRLAGRDVSRRLR